MIKRLTDILMEVAARLLIWAYSGFCLLFWDSNMEWCWVFSEAFLMALIIFIAMPIYTIWEIFKNTSCKAESNI